MLLLDISHLLNASSFVNVLRLFSLLPAKRLPLLDILRLLTALHLLKVMYLPRVSHLLSVLSLLNASLIFFFLFFLSCFNCQMSQAYPISHLLITSNLLSVSSLLNVLGLLNLSSLLTASHLPNTSAPALHLPC